MLLEVWLALFVAGILTSIAAFIVRTASLYAALINIIIWALIAIGSVELTVVSGGETVTVGAPAVAIVAILNALVSLPVVYLAAVGKWGQDTEDGLESTTGGVEPPTPERRNL